MELSVDNPRTIINGRKTILYGQTPKAIREKQLCSMAEAAGVSVTDFAKQILGSSTWDNFCLLQDYHTAQSTHLAQLFEQLSLQATSQPHCSSRVMTACDESEAGEWQGEGTSGLSDCDQERNESENQGVKNRVTQTRKGKKRDRQDAYHKQSIDSSIKGNSGAPELTDINHQGISYQEGFHQQTVNLNHQSHSTTSSDPFHHAVSPNWPLTANLPSQSPPSPQHQPDKDKDIVSSQGGSGRDEGVTSLNSASVISNPPKHKLSQRLPSDSHTQQQPSLSSGGYHLSSLIYNPDCNSRQDDNSFLAGLLFGESKQDTCTSYVERREGTCMMNTKESMKMNESTIICFKKSKRKLSDTIPKTVESETYNQVLETLLFGEESTTVTSQSDENKEEHRSPPALPTQQSSPSDYSSHPLSSLF